jgi:hypothetical protein
LLFLFVLVSPLLSLFCLSLFVSLVGPFRRSFELVYGFGEPGSRLGQASFTLSFLS